MSSNAELSLITANEEYLSDGEAWAWMSSLQLALRANASTQGLNSADDVDSATDGELVVIHVLQQLLFELADVLS